MGYDRKVLRDFAEKNQMRDDWHEPDEQGVTARVTGIRLDNAHGIIPDCEEMVIVLYKNGEEAVRVNLATVLALAAGTIE